MFSFPVTTASEEVADGRPYSPRQVEPVRVVLHSPPMTGLSRWTGSRAGIFF